MTIWDVLNAVGYSGITVDDEHVFVLYDEYKCISELAKHLELEVSNYRFYCPDEKLTEKIQDARTGDGEAESLVDLDDDYHLRLDELLRYLIGVSEVLDEGEVEACSDCGKLVYTRPQHYCDRGRFTRGTDGDITCASCTRDNADRHLGEYLESGGTIAFILDPADFGFYRINNIPYQNGLHHGMDDDPKGHRKYLAAAGIQDVIMTVEPSQFYVEWDIYVRVDDRPVATTLLTHGSELWVTGEGAALVVGFDDDAGCFRAHYRSCPDSLWSHEAWSYDDESRWHDLWTRHPDEVREFGHMTEADWHSRAAIALRRVTAPEPFTAWRRVAPSLKQLPPPATLAKQVLRGQAGRS